MSIVAERPHNKYGNAILIGEGLKVKSISVSDKGDVELISIVMPGVVIYSFHKSPNDNFAPRLATETCPHIVIGDFNSHSTIWGYNVTDNSGEAVEYWANTCNLSLIHDAKLPKSFNSAR